MMIPTATCQWTFFIYKTNYNEYQNIAMRDVLDSHDLQYLQ